MEGRPPRDFDPVAPARARLPGDECPDLVGTYDLAGTTLGAAIAERPVPDTHGLPVLLSLKHGATNTEAWWVVPRDRLLEFAADLRASSPGRYARWRALLLRGKLAGSREWDFNGFLAEVATLGPPGPLFAGIVSYRCEADWMRIREQPPAAGSNGTSEREIWLARDRSGALLVKTVDYQLKPFSIWGDSANSIRTSASASWQKVPAAPDADATPLVAADLPPVAALNEAHSSDCSQMPGRLVALSQRMSSMLPTGIELAYFQPQPPTPASTGGCRSPVLEVHFSGSDPRALEGIDARLLRDPDVRSIALLRAPGDKPENGLRRLRVVLR
jgi:hypothetical protein